MKKQLLSILLVGTSLSSWSQVQIANSNFELWETVASGEEPTNWNSFLSAGGSLSWAATDQCESSTDVRPGTTGTKSLRIFSNSVLGVIANGNCTVGKINMGSASPSNASNYNSSIIADANFSEAIDVQPDSVVFWAKFTPASGNTTDSARIATIIHDNYEFRDPSDANSLPHIVGTAIRNFAKTDGNWVRMAVPFTYSGPASTPAFILLTFATNKTPGGGTDNDILLIDDMELIYNQNNLDENAQELIQVVNQNGHISFVSKMNNEAAVEIFSTSGQLVVSGRSTQTFDLSQKGMYIVKMKLNNSVLSQSIVVQ
jgi:hypothetical protein